MTPFKYFCKIGFYFLNFNDLLLFEHYFLLYRSFLLNHLKLNYQGYSYNYQIKNFK